MIFAIGAAVFALAVAAPQAESPARRVSSLAPEYPAACMPPPGAEQKTERVTLAYSVSAEGRALDIRVRESTNACFDGPAVDAARLWSFEPRRVNGVAVRQDDVETTITYKLSDAARLVDSDVRPVLRSPPRYPERCMASAKDSEKVLVEFDVTAEGAVENVRVIESTGNCFNKPAVESVMRWRYRPLIFDGVAVPRRGVQTVVTFELVDDVSDLIRPEVARRLNSARRKLLKKNPDYDAVLAELDAIEAKFGAEFRPLEMSAFYPLRGAARIEAKNYRGALDDLRIARSLVIDPAAGEALQRTIESLEAYIAAEDAALARVKPGAPVGAAAPPTE